MLIVSIAAVLGSTAFLGIVALRIASTPIPLILSPIWDFACHVQLQDSSSSLPSSPFALYRIFFLTPLREALELFYLVAHYAHRHHPPPPSHQPVLR